MLYGPHQAIDLDFGGGAVCRAAACSGEQVPALRRQPSGRRQAPTPTVRMPQRSVGVRADPEERRHLEPLGGERARPYHGGRDTGPRSWPSSPPWAKRDKLSGRFGGSRPGCLGPVGWADVSSNKRARMMHTKTNIRVWPLGPGRPRQMRRGGGAGGSGPGRSGVFYHILYNGYAETIHEAT